VCRPRSANQQSNGEGVKPQVTAASRIESFVSGSRAIAKPRVTSECPASSLVTEWITTSAPWSKGRNPRGVVNVLSTHSRMPRSAAKPAIPATSATRRVGLDTVSRRMARVLGPIAASTAATSVVSASEVSNPRRGKSAVSSRRERPYS
jgi:hypothetical protein